MKNIEKIQELMKLEYDILIKKEAEDGEVYYSISYPELPGLTIYANTVEEGLEEIKNAKVFIAGRALVGESGKVTANAIREEIDKYWK